MLSPFSTSKEKLITKKLFRYNLHWQNNYWRTELEYVLHNQNAVEREECKLEPMENTIQKELWEL
jgi:hypothetical protein